MGLMAQHYFGTKRGNYYMMTARQWTAQQMLDWGMVSEVVPKDKVMERAWEIARLWKTMPYENRTIMSNLAKRPLKKLLVDDLKLHTVSEQYGSLLRIAAGEMGDTHAGQQDEKYISQTNDWRYCHDWMQQPPTRESWAGFRTKPFEWFKEVEAGKEVNPFDPNKKVSPLSPGEEGLIFLSLYRRPEAVRCLRPRSNLFQGVVSYGKNHHYRCPHRCCHPCGLSYSRNAGADRAGRL